MRLNAHHSLLDPEPIRLLQFMRRHTVLALVSLALIATCMTVVQLKQTANAQTTETRSNETEIALTVTVTTDKGGYVNGLLEESFTVLVDKRPQRVSRVAQVDEPVSIGILIDMSGSINSSSMQRLGAKRLSTIKDGLAHFIGLSNKENEYFVLGFATQPVLLSENTRESKEILSRIPAIVPKGYTVLYDACYLGVEKVALSTHRKRAIILISDGMDNASKRQLNELGRLLKETNVLVYCISVTRIRENAIQARDEDVAQLGNSILAEMAKRTAGLAFFPDRPTQIKGVFELIALDLQKHYTVVIQPQLSEKKNKWQSLEVKVTPPRSSSSELKRLTVRSREGFYPMSGLR